MRQVTVNVLQRKAGGLRASGATLPRWYHQWFGAPVDNVEYAAIPNKTLVFECITNKDPSSYAAHFTSPTAPLRQSGSDGGRKGVNPQRSQRYCLPFSVIALGLLEALVKTRATPRVLVMPLSLRHHQLCSSRISPYQVKAAACQMMGIVSFFDKRSHAVNVSPTIPSAIDYVARSGASIIGSGVHHDVLLLAGNHDHFVVLAPTS